jgi:hypothetical protein
LRQNPCTFEKICGWIAKQKKIISWSMQFIPKQQRKTKILLIEPSARTKARFVQFDRDGDYQTALGCH